MDQPTSFSDHIHRAQEEREARTDNVIRPGADAFRAAKPPSVELRADAFAIMTGEPAEVVGEQPANVREPLSVDPLWAALPAEVREWLGVNEERSEQGRLIVYDTARPNFGTPPVHDLAFAAEALELAQMELSMRADGPNSAHDALCAVQSARGKLQAAEPSPPAVKSAEPSPETTAKREAVLLPLCRALCSSRGVKAFLANLNKLATTVALMGDA